MLSFADESSHCQRFRLDYVALYLPDSCTQSLPSSATTTTTSTATKSTTTATSTTLSVTSTLQLPTNSPTHHHHDDSSTAATTAHESTSSSPTPSITSTTSPTLRTTTLASSSSTTSASDTSGLRTEIFFDTDSSYLHDIIQQRNASIPVDDTAIALALVDAVQARVAVVVADLPSTVQVTALPDSLAVMVQTGSYAAAKKLNQTLLQKEFYVTVSGVRLHGSLPPWHALDCVWTWSDWTPCNATCGEAQAMRVVRIIYPPQQGGRACPAQTFTTRRCSLPTCPAPSTPGTSTTPAGDGTRTPIAGGGTDRQESSEKNHDKGRKAGRDALSLALGASISLCFGL